MRFEQILADCIEALDQGETIDGCLARFPQYRAQLLPMLLLAVELRGQPKPRLSAKAFAQIRATLATNAQKAKGGYDSSAAVPLPVPTHNGRSDQAALPTPHHAGHRRGRPSPVQRQPGRPHRHYTLATDQPSAANRQGRRPWLRTLSMGLAFCLLVSLVVFARQMALSLPGTSLYGVKRASEQVQGIFMTAAGDGAQWHARQATLRIGELAQLPAAAPAQQEGLAVAVATHIESALAAGGAMPEPERTAFLRAWQRELQQLEATLPANAPAAEPARETVQTALAAVALALTPAPTVLPTISEPTPLAVTPVLLTTQATTVALTATATLTPALPVATPTLLTAPTPILTATATLPPTLTVPPTPVLIPSATASMTALPPIVSTATPLPVITQVMGLEESSSDEPDASQQEQDDAPGAGDTAGSTQETGADAQNETEATATSTPVGPDEALTAVPTAERLTSTPTADGVLFFTPTPATPAATIAPAQTSLPFVTPGLTQQPTLIAPEASTRVATPVEPQPTAQSTVSIEPATAVSTDAETSEPNNRRKVTATPEPTRTPKPTATNAANDATPTRRRTPEPTTQPTAAAEPTASDAP